MPNVTVVASNELATSWQWLRASASPRPNACSAGATHLRDDKKFAYSTPPGPLALVEGAPECTELARLYLASLVESVRVINSMAAGARAPDVRPAVPLDPSISGVLKSKKRFRAGFAEHLAFWLRLAEASRVVQGKFALARPNLQPEDKGHDGLSFELAPTSRTEVQSVKNSTADARRLVATPKFRNKGVATRGALLDDFWLLQNKSLNLQRLQNMLDDVTGSLGLAPNALAHEAVVLECTFNAIVVSNASQARPNLFDGYQHINQVPLGRVATFIGAQDWAATAAAVQSATLGILKAKGAI